MRHELDDACEPLSRKKSDLVHDRLSRAKAYAAYSSLKVFQTGAVIAKPRGKEIESVGWSHYSRLNLAQYRSIHAELHAVLCSDRSALDSADIYIATLNRKSGNFTSGRPCSLCLAVLNEVGIYRAFFTIPNNGWSYVYVNDEYRLGATG